ncbi:uncharacterized protein LOC143283825 [Babylonia areolata]|uniref:uncharacterized protein LOC143283825 n=1 Tax=Babylonia areolata TaxID=304850 RepID=UPI003FD169C0
MPFLEVSDERKAREIDKDSKAFCAPFENYLEDFASNIFYELNKASAKAQELFTEVCQLLDITPRVPIRPVGSRFLQMIEVSNRLQYLQAPMFLYFYGYLTASEKKEHEQEYEDILSKHGVNEDERRRLEEIHRQNKACANESSNRRDLILTRLFRNRERTLLLLDVYRGVLPEFQKFVKIHQSEKPLVHELHANIYKLTEQFIGLFIKSDNMPQRLKPSIAKLLKIDVKDQSIQLTDEKLYVGSYAWDSYKKCRFEKRHWMAKFQDNLRQGYEDACYALQNKLPLRHVVLSNLSAFDPELRGKEDTFNGLTNLAQLLPNVIQQDELGELQKEARQYVNDTKLDGYLPSYRDNERIDTDWWGKISELKKEDSNEPLYPYLSKLASACLSVFTGPLIEGTFNIMDDIIERDRAKIEPENYEAVALTKSALKSLKEKSCTLKIKHKMRMMTTNSYTTYLAFQSSKKKKKKDILEDRIRNAKEVQRAHSTKKRQNQVGCGPGRMPSRPSSQPPNPKPSTQPSRPSSQPINPKPSTQRSRPPSQPSNPTPSTQPFSTPSQPPNPTPSTQPSQPSDVNARKSFFTTLQTRLQNAATHSFYDLKVLAVKAEKHEAYKSSSIGLYSEFDSTLYHADRISKDLYPEDAPDHLEPVEITGDGNCLPRSVSVLAYGTQDHHQELRTRIIVEMAAHEDHYTSLSVSKAYAMSSDFFEMQDLSPLTIKDIFRKEVASMCHQGKEMGVWQIHAAASVLQTPLMSIYPKIQNDWLEEYGEEGLNRNHLNKVFHPRIFENDSEVRSVPGIMWTRMGRVERVWRPNHFVACLPKTNGPRMSNTSLTAQKKRGSADIRQFFSKKARVE